MTMFIGAIVLLVLLQLNFNFAPSFATSPIINGYCTCPGDQLMFECTAIGGFATIWNGSAFIGCVPVNKHPNEIFLPHSRYIAGLMAASTMENQCSAAHIQGADSV